MPVAYSLGAFALYLSTLAPGMLRGDAGEFQWAMATLGVTHATGYPLFTLLGFLWLHLPLGGSAAWRLNLLSPVFGALAVATIFIFARSITRRTEAALVGATFFALAPVFWVTSSILEKYSLNAFLLALILYWLWQWSRQSASQTPPRWKARDLGLYLAFFSLGLALAHHRMITLALPGIVVFLVLIEHRFFLNVRRLIALVLLMLPGLALYAYVPIRLPASGASLDYAIFDIILGRQFSGSLLHQINPPQLIGEVLAQNFHVGLLFAVPGAIALFKRERNLAVLLTSVFILDICFAFVYSVPNVEVFLTPSFVILALWIACGAAELVKWGSTRRHYPVTSYLGFAVPSLLLVLSAVNLTQYQNVREEVRAAAGSVEARARALLAADLSPNAVLELDWETATAVRFLEATERLRPDLEARLIKLDSPTEYWWVLQNVDAGRAVYVENSVKWTRAAAGYRVEPATYDLLRIVRVPVTMQNIGVRLDKGIELVGLKRDDRALVLFWRVSQPLGRDLATFVHFFDAAGKPIGQEDHAGCCEATFAYRTSGWEPNKLFSDTFRAPPPEAVSLEVGLYTLNAGDIEPFGRTLHLQIPEVIRPDAQPLEIPIKGTVGAGFSME